MSEPTEASFLKLRLAEIVKDCVDPIAEQLHEMVQVRFMEGVTDPDMHRETEPIPFGEGWDFVLYNDPKERMGDRFTEVPVNPVHLLFSPTAGNPILTEGDPLRDESRLKLKVCPGGVYNVTDEKWLETNEVKGLYGDLEPVFYPKQS